MSYELLMLTLALCQDPYASNWLERLRHIKRLKTKVLKEQQDEETSGQLHDFTGLWCYSSANILVPTNFPLQVMCELKLGERGGKE